MTSTSARTCKACDRLITRGATQARRPRIALPTSKDSRCTVRPALRTIRTRLRDLLIPGPLGEPSPQQTCTAGRDAGTTTELLAQAFGHPHGAGFIGPGANPLLRTMLTEALTGKAGVAQVITTRVDLDRLLSPLSAETVIESSRPRLQVTESLEDAIEHLENEADMTTMIRATNDPSSGSPAVVWFATPGPDADVVHETLQRWPANSLIALMSGLWPYGPTHVIEEAGPRPLPSQPIPLLSAEQAVMRLSGNTS
ncbi:hypothetical protein [Actinomadura livida]|uniref:Uncharacterized protein n=1 Tax=Actinomadura livida TaxID=79909 RepID=A0A7W7I7L7_9ACTN|nr:MULTISPECIES: hypothetical protein [Actinomadura]MBB4771869.1 hypothetical protein [Actinomadura catellatispora]GGU02999.1 hypothetical protein GCM10010208_28910 [Actinomadura livida]